MKTYYNCEVEKILTINLPLKSNNNLFILSSN